MSLIVHPDPQQPAGGYAFFELPEGTLSGDEARVAIYDAYGERWLADTGQWQAELHEFGPYKVYRHEGAEWLRMGPEIVNEIEEYAPLKIRVAGRDYDVTWPDDVPPRAGAAVRGELKPVARAQAEASVSQLVGRVARAPEPEPERKSVPDLPPDPEDGLPAEPVFRTPEPDLPARRPGRTLLWALGVILLLILGASIWWYLNRADVAEMVAAGPEPAVDDATVASDAAAPGTLCSREALNALSGGFAEVGTALRDCGADVSPDTALALVETYAGDGDPAALYLFGALYDGEILEERIENLIGLTFDADDAKAAEYYDRAVKAGSAPAQAALAATCERLSESGDTLARGAFDDYCR